MSSINFSGLVSGIDSDPIIAQLNRFNQARLDSLGTKQEEAVEKQTIFKTVEARVLTLQASISSLSKVRNGAFDARTSTSSDENILKVAANGSATEGVHTFTVNQTAKANIQGSGQFTSETSEIKTGTFTISAGGAATTITVDSTNNTLRGLAGAINAADVDVQATIIDDGSTGDSFRLLLRSENTGTDNAISVTDNLTGGSGTDLNLSTVQTAQDAQIQIGSGAGAITVTESDNTVTGLIPGVTLDLQSADSSKEVTVTIANDVSSIQGSIENFVTEFNALVDFIDAQTRFDPETLTGGPLVGDRRLIDLKSQVTSEVLSVSNTLSSDINRLSAFGIKIGISGKLTIDSAVLSDFLNGDIDGLDFDDVKKAFALNGESTNTGVRFVFGSDDTKESVGSPYQVDITQAAEQAEITATSTITNPGATVITSSNNQLTVAVSGVGSETITLTEGTYTQTELATELQTRLRGDDNIGRFGLSVAVSSDKLVLTTGNYGSAASISSVNGNAASTLGFDGTETDTGQDVAGSFLVGGVTETATGVGQVLRADKDNANTDGINLVVDLTSAQVTSGVEAELTVTRGIASRLTLAFESIVDPGTGRLKAINDAFASEVDDIQQQIADEQATLDDNTAALLRQFAALEDSIQRSRASGDLITNNLAPLLTRNSSSR